MSNPDEEWVDDDTPGEEERRALLDWGFAHGVRLNANIIESHGLGLSANGEEVAVEVPESLCFSAANLQLQAEKDPLLKAWLDILPMSQHYHILQRGLLFYYTFQQHSLYEPYLAALPKHVGLPFVWPEEQLEQLEGTSIYEPAVSKRVSLEQLYHTFVESIELKKMVDAKGVNAPSLEQWMLVYEWIASRALSHPTTGEVYVVPFIDLCNHSSSHTARYEFSNGKFLLLIDNPSTRPGQELTLNYGARGNGEFLFNYGFTPTEPTSELLRAYNALDPAIRFAMGPIGSTEEYELLIEYFTRPVQMLRIYENGDWIDEFILVVALGEDVEFRETENNTFALFLNNKELIPGYIPGAILEGAADRRGDDIVRNMCRVFLDRLGPPLGSSIREVRQLAEQEATLYHKYIG